MKRALVTHAGYKKIYFIIIFTFECYPSLELNSLEGTYGFFMGLGTLLR